VEQQQRVARTTMECGVQSSSANRRTVSGGTRELTANTRGEVGKLQVGTRVSVIVQSDADGSLEAISITIAPLTPTATTSGATAPSVSARATPRPSDAPTATRAPRGTSAAPPASPSPTT